LPLKTALLQLPPTFAMKTTPITHGELAGLRAEFRHEIAAVRHEIDMIELRRRFEMQAATTKALWRRGLQAYFIALLANVLAIIGTLYWFAKLLGH
jgi:hypothetical protein